MYIQENDVRNFQTRRAPRGRGVIPGRAFRRGGLSGLGFVRYTDFSEPPRPDATSVAVPVIINPDIFVGPPPPPVVKPIVTQPPPPTFGVTPPPIAARPTVSDQSFWDKAWQWGKGLLTSGEEREIRDMVQSFPAVLRDARESWALYRIGVKAGLFSPSERGRVRDHYREFPRLFETVKPELEKSNTQALREGAAFVRSLAADPLYTAGLGIVPLVIAGVLIAGAFGVGGAIWAVGYVKEQRNISKMIDATVAGNLPPEILEAALQDESFFGDIGGFGITTIALAIGAIIFGPKILKGMRG